MSKKDDILIESIRRKLKNYEFPVDNTELWQKLKKSLSEVFSAPEETVPEVSADTQYSGGKNKPYGGFFSPQRTLYVTILAIGMSILCYMFFTENPQGKTFSSEKFHKIQLNIVTETPAISTLPVKKIIQEKQPVRQNDKISEKETETEITGPSPDNIENQTLTPEEEFSETPIKETVSSPAKQIKMPVREMKHLPVKINGKPNGLLLKFTAGSSLSTEKTELEHIEDPSGMPDVRLRQIKYHSPLNISLTANKQLSPHWSLESGITYNRQQISTSETSSREQSQTTATLQSIGLPVKIQYNFFNNKKISFYGSTGGMMEKNIKGSQEATRIRSEWIELLPVPGGMEEDETIGGGGSVGAENPPATPDYIEVKLEEKNQSELNLPSIRWSVFYHLGMSYKFDRHWRVVLEPGISYYFNNHDINAGKPEKFNFNATGGIVYEF